MDTNEKQNSINIHPETKNHLVEDTPWRRILKDPWENLARTFPGIEKLDGFDELKEWFNKQVEKLDNFEVETIPLEETLNVESSNQEGKWIAASQSIAPETKGNVMEIRRLDSKFFSVKGIRVNTTDPITGEKKSEWTQSILVGDETPLTLKIFGEKQPVPVYGMIISIKDSDGNYLVSVGQEPMSENEKNCTIRLAVQASGAKIANTITGAKGGDAGLLDLLKAYDCNNMDDLLEKANAILLEPPEDLDRIYKHNVIGIMPDVDQGSELHQRLVASGKRKWVSKAQFDMLALSGLANSHTTGCVAQAERFIEMKKQVTKEPGQEISFSLPISSSSVPSTV